MVTNINKTHCGFLTDTQLTLKAKGLLAIINSMPNGWKFSINGIMQMIPEGRTVVYSAINELKEYGYCLINPIRDSKGRVKGNDYIFYEEPHTVKPKAENPHSENPHSEKPHTDNEQLDLMLEQTENENNIELKEKRISYDEIKNLWNKTCTMFPSITVISKKRQEKIRSRFEEFSAVGEPFKVFETLLDKISKSTWMTVESRENWRKGIFDWLFTNSENWVKVWEGKYDDQKPTMPLKTYKNDYWQ